MIKYSQTGALASHADDASACRCRAARFCHSAAHGGQILLPRVLAESLILEWTGTSVSLANKGPPGGRSETARGSGKPAASKQHESVHSDHDSQEHDQVTTCPAQALEPHATSELFCCSACLTGPGQLCAGASMSAVVAAGGCGALCALVTRVPPYQPARQPSDANDEPAGNIIPSWVACRHMEMATACRGLYQPRRPLC